MLTNLSQIKGGLKLRSDVDSLLSYREGLDASQILTSILEDSSDDTSAYNVDDILHAIIGENWNATDDLSSIKALATALTNFKNKEIKDAVRVSLTATHSAGAFTVDTTSVDAGLKTDDNVALPVYLADGRVVYANNTGSAQLTFNLKTGALSGTPYVMVDDDADRTQSETETGVTVYTALADDFNFKVFATGTYTLATLPTDALLDNQEMKSLAYDQAIDQIVLKLAADEDIVAAIAALVGDTAVQTQIQNVTQYLYPFASIEGTAAVPESSEGAGDGVAAESITASTAVYSKNKVDQIITNLNTSNTTELNKKYEFANIDTATAVTAVSAASTFGAVDYVAARTAVTAEGDATKSTHVPSTALVNTSIEQAVKAALETASTGVYAVDAKTYDFANIVGLAANAARGSVGDPDYVAASSAETVTETTAVYSKNAVDYIISVVQADRAGAIATERATALGQAQENASRIDAIEGCLKAVVETKNVTSSSAVTSWNLEELPNATLVKMYINGLVYFEGDEFTVDRTGSYGVVNWSFTASDQAGHEEGVDGFSITNAMTSKVRFEYFVGAPVARTIPAAS